MGIYLDLCGALPTEGTGWSDYNKWWKCAIETAYAHGVCVSADNWNLFFPNVRSDIAAKEAATAYFRGSEEANPHGAEQISITLYYIPGAQKTYLFSYICGAPPPSPPEALTFFADIADYFHSIENTVIIGPVFGLIADAFDLADTWLVWVNSLAGQIPSMATVKSWILGTYTSIDSWMDAQPGKVKTWILGTYTSLDTWLDAQPGKVKTWILGTYASLDAWLDAKKATVKSWILGTYASLDEWLDAKKATVKSWILGTYASLDAWLDAKKATVKSWILGTYTDLASWLTAQQTTVKGWILGSYTSLDTWLDAQEEKVITLVKGAVVDLLDELIDTVDDWVDDRVDAIKDIVEKIVMKL